MQNKCSWCVGWWDDTTETDETGHHAVIARFHEEERAHEYLDQLCAPDGPAYGNRYGCCEVWYDDDKNGTGESE